MAKASERDARQYYDDFSDSYERGRGYGYHQMIDDLEVEVTAPYARDARVLELGCGTGLILARIAEFAEEAVGIDLSEGMAQRARDRGLDVRIGSVCDLPFEDDRFDLTYSFKVLAHVPDIEAAIREAARVTRPEPNRGGHLHALGLAACDPKAVAAQRRARRLSRRARPHPFCGRASDPMGGTRAGPSRAPSGSVPASILRRLPDRHIAQVVGDTNALESRPPRGYHAQPWP